MRGFSARGAHRPARRNATITCGVTRPRSTPACASSSLTPSRPTGRGTPRRTPITGTGSSHTSRISTTTIPAVLREILGVVDYWLGMGVDGLRLDAVPYRSERDGTSCENLPETHAVIRATSAQHVDRHYANRMLLAEANQWPADVRGHFGDAGRVPHGVSLSADAPPVHGDPHQEDRFPIAQVLWRRRLRFPTPVSGPCSCATTTN